MQLETSTWQEVEAYLQRSDGIILPTGSTEQHGPMGLIGTDTICAREIASRVGETADVLVAPAIGWTPAPFNMDFPGTISVTEALFESLVGQIIDGLRGQGFGHFYVLNGHGANLAPLRKVAASRPGVCVRSWWDFDAVNVLRWEFYGDWEGMHATPSEVAITQATHRIVEPGIAADPPRKLTAEFIEAHAGDRHGPAKQHRAEFPDGRVGSHSALAGPEHGQALLAAAASEICQDYDAFLRQR
jgi:creatinine amidohydrolase